MSIDVKLTDGVYLEVIGRLVARIAELELKATAMEHALRDLNADIPDDGTLLKVVAEEDPSRGDNELLDANEGS